MKIEMSDEFYYRVKDENNISLYQKLNTSKDNVLRNNDRLKFYNGEWVKVKVNDFIIHVVKPTETIDKIAQIYGVEQESLKKVNALKTDKLFIGQTIKIFKHNTNVL